MNPIRTGRLRPGQRKNDPDDDNHGLPKYWRTKTWRTCGASASLCIMAQSLAQFEADHTVFTGWPLGARRDVGAIELGQGKDYGKRRKERK